MTINDFYEKKILEKSISKNDSDQKLSVRRYNNYPWSLSSIQIEHDFSKKSVSSPKYVLMKKLRKNEVDRQNKATSSLFSGYSSRILPKQKLPPIIRKKILD